MPVALPGYVDTGRTLSATYTATLRLTVLGAGIMLQSSWPGIATFFGTAGFVSMYVGDWVLRGTQLFDNGSLGGPGAGNGRTYIWLDRVTGYNAAGAPIYTYEALETIDWTAAVADGAAAQKQSAAYAFSDVMGSFRLGMYYGRIPPGAAVNPEFAPRDYRTTYVWWGDNNTTRQCSFAGYSFAQVWNLGGGGGTGPWRTAANVNTTPVSAGSSLAGIDITFGGDSNVSVSLFPGTTFGTFSGLSYSGGALDTSTLDGPNLKGDGGGGAHLENNTNDPDGASAAPPYSLGMDLSLTKFGGIDIGAELVLPSYIAGGAATTPFVGTYAVRQVSWEDTWSGYFVASINPTWAAAQNPALPATDLYAPLWFDPPLGSGQNYLPVGISLSPEIEVHRPGGVIPSLWVASDARITVTENMSETVIVVHEAGATIQRTFAGTQNWRNRVGLGVGGTLHDDFEIENYEVQRHNYTGWGVTGEDAWAWGTYAWLAYEISAPEESSLALVANGNWLEINDPHTTGSGRVAGYTATLVPYAASYALDLPNELNTGLLDLLFPATPVPFYHGRVDSLVMSGFKVGTYRIRKLRFQATGQAYLKIASGLQVQRSDYSALVAAVNGAFVFGNWPDETGKPDETGDYGGGIRYVNYLTGDPSGLILDTQKSLSEFILLLNKIEGWAASYSMAVHDTAMTDAYGTTLGPELAQFLKPVVPYHRLTPGAVFHPDCAVLSRDVQTAAGIPFSVVCLWPLWGALEGQAKTDGRRAEGGAPVDAIRVDTGAVVATGETDEDGFACIAPVPANGVLVVTLQDGA